LSHLQDLISRNIKFGSDEGYSKKDPATYWGTKILPITVALFAGPGSEWKIVCQLNGQKSLFKFACICKGNRAKGQRAQDAGRRTKDRRMQVSGITRSGSKNR